MVVSTHVVYSPDEYSKDLRFVDADEYPTGTCLRCFISHFLEIVVVEAIILKPEMFGDDDGNNSIDYSRPSD